MGRNKQRAIVLVISQDDFKQLIIFPNPIYIIESIRSAVQRGKPSARPRAAYSPEACIELLCTRDFLSATPVKHLGIIPGVDSDLAAKQAKRTALPAAAETLDASLCTAISHKFRPENRGLTRRAQANGCLSVKPSWWNACTDHARSGYACMHILSVQASCRPAASSPDADALRAGRRNTPVVDQASRSACRSPHSVYCIHSEKAACSCHTCSIKSVNAADGVSRILGKRDRMLKAQRAATAALEFCRRLPARFPGARLFFQVAVPLDCSRLRSVRRRAFRDNSRHR